MGFSSWEIRWGLVVGRGGGFEEGGEEVGKRGIGVDTF